MDPSKFEFYINPAGTMFYQGNVFSYAWSPEGYIPEDVVSKTGLDVREVARLTKLWNTLRDNASPLRTQTIYHVEAFLESGEMRGGAAVFVSLQRPSWIEKYPERKRWAEDFQGHYVVRQKAVNLAQTLEDAGFVSFFEEQGLGKWDVGAYVSSPKEVRDAIRVMKGYIEAEMGLLLSWFPLA